MSAIGDIIHALPVSAAIGEAFPHIDITWIVEEPFVPILDGNPYLNQIISIPKLKLGRIRDSTFRAEYRKGLKQVRHARFDVTLDLQGLSKSALIAAASGAKVRLGYHWLREAAALIEQPVPKRPESVHIVDQYLDVARFLGANPNPVKFPFCVPPEEIENVDKLLAENGIGASDTLISINPAAGHPLKQWGTDRYAALMDSLLTDRGIRSVLVTADKAVADEVAAQAKQPFVNLQGKTSLKGLAAVLLRSAVHICGDTGSAHMAAALNRAVIALIGPTDADRACPYGQRANAFSNRQFCDPKCDWHHCAFAKPKCMASIEVAQVVEKASELVG